MGKSPDWLDDDDLFDDDDGSVDEVAKDAPVLSRRGAKKDSPPPSRREEVDDDDIFEEPGEKKPGKMAQLALKHSKRPGEQEIAKSPLVLALGAGIAILTIMAGTYWFMIGRDVVTKEFMAIQEDIDQQRYGPAIKKLDDFIIKRGRHERINEAKFMRAKARVDKEVAGSVPNWAEGLAMVDLYIKDCRDLEGYPDRAPELLEYSVKISKGSLETSASDAKKAKDEEALDSCRTLITEVSDLAALNIDGFSPEDSPPTKAKAEIKVLREAAERAIHKRSQILKAYAAIEGFLNKKLPIPALKARRDLIVQYPDLERDRKLKGYLDEAIAVEKSLISKEELDRPASTEDRPLPVPAPLALTPHTRSSTEEVSDGRNIFGVAMGCCYGVDAVTGDTKWRRAVGPDTPFFPKTVKASTDALLVFDTTWQELVLINQDDGKLIWRQPIDEPVSGAPLLEGSQIYLPTRGNHLYQIELESGQIRSKLTFSQPLYAPPVLVRDSANIVIAGDEGVTYVIERRQMDCTAIWPTFQAPSSIDVPLLAMGSLILMAENGASAGCTLRVFDASDIENDFPEVGTKEIPTQVRDPLLLRGNKLFVPAVGEQFNAFTVSDSKDQEPLLDIARPQSSSEYDGAVYLLDGPEGRLWSASDNLRQFQLTQDSLLEDQEKRIAIGAAGQPLQRVDETVFVGQRQLGSDAIRIVQVDGEGMTEFGKTVIGAGVLALTPLDPNTVLCLTRTGELFKVSAQDIETGGFMFRSDGALKIPEDVHTPLVAVALPDRQIAVGCGGNTPQLWIVNQAGKVAQEVPLSAPPVFNPIALAGGAVVSLPTRLRLLGMPGGRTADDFLGVVEQEDKVQWASVVAIDDESLLLTRLNGNIERISYRTSPKPHLQGIETLQVGEAVHVPPAVSGGRVVVAAASGKLQLLDVVGFREEAQVGLPAPAFGTMSILGERLLVQTEDDQLRCLALDQKLKELWSVAMTNDALSGSPAASDGNVTFGTMNGVVKTLKLESGEEVNSMQLDQPIEHGPLTIGPHQVVISVDGSFYRIGSPQGDDS